MLARFAERATKPKQVEVLWDSAEQEQAALVTVPREARWGNQPNQTVRVRSD
jgi:hypothetical protein